MWCLYHLFDFYWLKLFIFICVPQDVTYIVWLDCAIIISL